MSLLLGVTMFMSWLVTTSVSLVTLEATNCPITMCFVSLLVSLTCNTVYW